MKNKKKVILRVIGIMLLLIIVGGGILLFVDPYAKAFKCILAYKYYIEEQEKIVYEGESVGSGGGAADVAYTDTNVRTEGVEEPDAVKTDGHYFYQTSSNGRTLLIYEANDGQVEKICEQEIFDENYFFTDLYIDGDKLIILGNYYDGDKKDEYTFNQFSYDNQHTFISFWDVSDRTSPKEESTIFQDGFYCSARVKDGILYTFSKKTIYTRDLKVIDFLRHSSYVPKVDGKFIPARDIVVFDKSYANYLVTTAINTDNEKLISSLAVMGGSPPYVSEENIYITHHEWGDDDETEFVKIALSDGDLKVEAQGSFKGGLLNDYSIDESEGYLRLVTSYRRDSGDSRRRNALYVFDEDLKEVSSIMDIAPDETVRSARFMGDIAYFVTYKVQQDFCDPLFAVDLSDPRNPKITDHMELPGFSGYLHPYGENKLLGIGYDTDEATGSTLCVKFSMFDTTDVFDIKEEATCNFLWCQEAYVLNNRNALLYDPEDGTFGFGAWISDYRVDDILELSEEDAATKVEYTPEEYTYTNEKGALIQDMGPVLSENVAISDGSFSYLLLDYDEEEGFQLILNHELSDTSRQIDAMNARGIVMGDYLYVVESDGGVTSYDTTDYEVVDKTY